MSWKNDPGAWARIESQDPTSEWVMKAYARATFPVQAFTKIIRQTERLLDYDAIIDQTFDFEEYEEEKSEDEKYKEQQSTVSSGQQSQGTELKVLLVTNCERKRRPLCSGRKALLGVVLAALCIVTVALLVRYVFNAYF